MFRCFRFSFISKTSSSAIFAPANKDLGAGEQTITRQDHSLSRRLPGFAPDPLSPEIKWTSNLVRALSDADRLVGRTAGEGARLPNPHLLMRPFVRREAVLSSRIEGTQATLGELLAAEAGAVVEHGPDDLREVGNYVVVLERGLGRLNKLIGRGDRI